jgi:hypothetical protein
MAGWKGTVPSQQEQGRDRCRDRAMQPCARASVSVVLYFSINNMSERGLGGVEWIGWCGVDWVVRSGLVWFVGEGREGRE